MQDFEGEITRNPEPITLVDGESFQYFVSFKDNPQDVIDGGGPCIGAEILEKYLTKV